MVIYYNFPGQSKFMGIMGLDATVILPRRFSGCIGEFSSVVTDLRPSCGDSESAVENASAGGGNVSRSPLAFRDGRFGALSRGRTSGA